MTTIEINYKITDLTNDPLEDYNCNICFENIYKKELYQCKEGHISCLSCWNESLNRKKECMICRIPINNIADLSRTRVLEKMLNKKIISCPYSFENIHQKNKEEELIIKNINNINNNNNEIQLIKDNIYGCKEEIKIENLEHHLINCEFRFIKCDNQGCKNNNIRFNLLKQHKELNCKYQIVNCECCNKPMIKKIIEKHYHDECKQFKIQCKECGDSIERFKLPIHLNQECENIKIQCKFNKYGCDESMKRKELNQHLLDIDHTIQLCNHIDQIEIKVNNLENSNSILKNQYISQSIEIEKLKNKINELKFQKKKRYYNQWKIFNFTQRINSIEGNIVKSHLFTFNNFNFYFRIEIKSDNLELHLFNSNKQTIKLKYKITLINHIDNSKNITNKISMKEFFSNKGWGWDKFLPNSSFNQSNNSLSPRSILKNTLSKENGWLSSNDELTFEFSLAFLNENRPLLSESWL